MLLRMGVKLGFMLSEERRLRV